MTAGRNVNGDNVDWNSPPKIIEKVNQFFGGSIELDPCSNADSMVNALTSYVLSQDGLSLSWNFKTIYVNPPYGRAKGAGTSILNWFRRCVDAHESFESQVLALVPVATNTRHWKECVFGKCSAICFLFDTRLKFYIGAEECKRGAPMACAIVYWGQNAKKFKDTFCGIGNVVLL